MAANWRERASESISVKEFVLAVVAAVGVVGDVERIFELSRFNELVAQAGGQNEIFGLLTIMARKTRGERGDGKSAVAQDLMRSPSQVRGIGTAGKSDEHGIKPAEGSKQIFLLAERLRHIYRGRSSGSNRQW